jgi:hypothetical protein
VSPLTIEQFLDRPLSPLGGVPELTQLTAQIAAQPLEETVADLRRVIKARAVTIEDQRRLHVLISELYHRCTDADLDLVGRLRAEIVAAYEVGRSGVLLRDEGRR